VKRAIALVVRRILEKEKIRLMVQFKLELEKIRCTLTTRTYSGSPPPPPPPVLLPGEPILLVEAPPGEVVDRKNFLRFN
jgi:hypothetical protein